MWRYPVLILGVLLVLLLDASVGEVLISQIVEGSSYNKAVVLSNRGSEDVSLGDYLLKIAYNGGEWDAVGDSLPNVTLSAGASFCFCNNRISADATPFCDTYDSRLLFNGNDAVGLYKEGILVDTFGDPTFANVSDAFNVAGVTEAGRDHTIVRTDECVHGDTDWATSSKTQWDVYPMNTLIGPQGSQVVLDPQGEEESAPSDKPSNTTKPPREDPVLRPVGPSTVRRDGKLLVGTFNVEWLFDGVDDVRFSPYAGDPEKAEKHLERIVKVIKRIEPDILNLCEVEDAQILQEVAQRVGGGSKGFFVKGTDTATDQDVALLSKIVPTLMTRTSSRMKYPLEDSVCGSTREGDTSVSKNYYATFDDKELFPFKFAMVAAHFKAFPIDPKSCSQREGQAAVLQTVIADLISKGYEVMVLGDLNDFSEKTLDVSGNFPKSRVMSMMRDPDGDGEDELQNVLELIPEASRYTSAWDKDDDEKVEEGEASVLDHILLTKGLWNRVEKAWIDHTHDPFEVSDHWPVLVQFKTDLCDAYQEL